MVNSNIIVYLAQNQPTMTQNPLEFRNSLTTAEFLLQLYKLPIEKLNEYLDSFDHYGLIDDCKIIQKVLQEKINAIVTRID